MNDAEIKALIGELVLQIASLNNQINSLNKKIEEYERNLRSSDSSSL